jgi:hypothetical protein
MQRDMNTIQNTTNPLKGKFITDHESFIQRSELAQLQSSNIESTSLPDTYKNNWSSRLIDEEITIQMMTGRIPNLKSLCYDLYHSFLYSNYPYSPLQFIPVMQKFGGIKRAMIRQLADNSTMSHVLVKNSLMKVVLIYWKPGESTDIHGHPNGGGVIKVLHGNLLEKRYKPDGSLTEISESNLKKGTIAHIDDSFAHHAVSNPNETPAVSLHVYIQKDL